MTFLYYFFLSLFLIFSVFTCFIILIQESKSLGLGSSLGGSANESLFGTSTAEVLKKFTAYLVGIFMISCVVLSLWTASLGRNAEKMIPAYEETEQVDDNL